MTLNLAKSLTSTKFAVELLCNDKSPEEVAREFIDRIVAINRRYGMGDSVSQEIYNEAIERATKAFGRLKAL